MNDINECDFRLLNKFLTHAECVYLIDKHKDSMHRSTVVKQTGNEISETRTSSSAFTCDSDDLICKIKMKVADYVKLPVSHVERIQFLRYQKDEFYKYHNDYFVNPIEGSQRIHTVLIYLNSLCFDDGGATSFFHYKIKVFPKEGSAVWFRNASDDGSVVYPQSMHSGEVIMTDKIKYALNIWIRNKPIT